MHTSKDKEEEEEEEEGKRAKLARYINQNGKRAATYTSTHITLVADQIMCIEEYSWLND